MALKIMALYRECCYADSRDYLNVILSIVTLGVVMLNVVMLSVVAPFSLQTKAKPKEMTKSLFFKPKWFPQLFQDASF